MARRERRVHSADYWQKRAERKRKIRQVQLRRRIAATVFIFLILAIVIGLIFYLGRDRGESAEETSVREPVVVTAEDKTPEESGAESVQETAEPIDISDDPRASFAVDPSFTAWNYEGDGTKTVYLTFDDGPSPLTPEILNILDQYGIKATFFVTSQLPQYASYIREAYLRGHTIGLHSYTHDYSIYSSEEDYLSDLAKIGEVVKTQIGYVPCFIRFPGGASNEMSKDYCEGIMSVLTVRVQELGYQYYDWNVATGDGAEGVTVDQEVENALNTDASTVVLLAHDGEKKQVTVEALPRIIQGYLDRGYTFKAIDRSSMVIHHPVFN